MGNNEVDVAGADLAATHARLREAAAGDSNPDWRRRDAWLEALERLLRENMPAIAAMTVKPEISTARPEVAAAMSSASADERPLSRSSIIRRR